MIPDEKRHDQIFKEFFGNFPSNSHYWFLPNQNKNDGY